MDFGHKAQYPLALVCGGLVVQHVVQPTHDKAKHLEYEPRHNGRCAVR